MKKLLLSFTLLTALSLNNPAYGGLKEIKEKMPSRETCLGVVSVLMLMGLVVWNVYDIHSTNSLLKDTDNMIKKSDRYLRYLASRYNGVR